MKLYEATDPQVFDMHTRTLVLIREGWSKPQTQRTLDLVEWLELVQTELYGRDIPNCRVDNEYFDILY